MTAAPSPPSMIAPRTDPSRSVAAVRWIGHLLYLTITVGVVAGGGIAASRISGLAAHEIVALRHPDVLATDPTFLAPVHAPRRGARAARRSSSRVHASGVVMRRTDASRFVFTVTQPCELGSIHDGDTVRCGGARVRLRGIDAPEIPDQPGAVAARDALANLLHRGPVELTIVSEDATDQYGRTLAYLTVYPTAGAPIQVNETLARNGLAYPFHPRGAPRAAQDDRIDAAARVAAAQHRGVYGIIGACLPVDFRHGRCRRAPDARRY